MFLDAHSAIEKVIFIGDDNGGGTANPGPNGSSDDKDGDDDDDEGEGQTADTLGVNIWAMVMAFGGVSIFAGLILVGRDRHRRRLRNDHEDEYSYDPDKPFPLVGMGESSVIPLSSAFSSAADSDLGVIGDDDRDLERSSPHDLDTIRISNKNLSDEMEVNVDLESFESVGGDVDGDGDGDPYGVNVGGDGDPYGVNVGGDGSGSGENFDFFDLILESSRDATEMQQDRDRIRGRNQDAPSDDISSLSYAEI